MRSTFLIAIALAFPTALAAQQPAPQPAPQPLTLEQAIAIGQRQGPDAKAAQAARDREYFTNKAFRARLLPQVGLSGEAPSLNRAINPVTLNDGSVAFVPQGFVQSNIDLRVSQQVPQAGGEFYVSSGLERLDVLGNDVQNGQRFWNSTPFAVGFTQPIFRPRERLWQSRTQDLAA